MWFIISFVFSFVFSIVLKCAMMYPSGLVTHPKALPVVVASIYIEPYISLSYMKLCGRLNCLSLIILCQVEVNCYTMLYLNNKSWKSKFICKPPAKCKLKQTRHLKIKKINTLQIMYSCKQPTDLGSE